ncbi:hypothetical protein DFH09DRAFT_1277652 [Mycena vulgaris]|nr:hypothetical protein DFH09DRAFT_1277652 [Mycena vulgaris]
MKPHPSGPTLSFKDTSLTPQPDDDASGEFPVIPPRHPFRTLVLCFDGTGGQFDSQNSNVVQFFSTLDKGDRAKQMVYYQPGIGTDTAPRTTNPLGKRVSKFLDEMVAWNLHAHVMGGYEFLMQNYTANDRICIFGFARGAYIARSLAGMIHKVGLLPASNLQQVPFAWKMYADETETGWKQSNAFKKAFSIDVDIEFIGVWNTVSSVGLIPRQLPFTTSNTIVRTFRHAVSLDETRIRFQPNLWNGRKDKARALSPDQESSRPKHLHPHTSQNLMEHMYARDPTQPTDVEEVWFAGCHSDVGGGSVDNATEHTLACIPLRWMIRECFKTRSGIMFDSEGLEKIGLNPRNLYPDVAPRPPPLPVGNLQIQPIPSSTQDQRDAATTSGPPSILLRSEEDMDLHDSLAPLYDQLKISWFWWLLEFMQPQRYQRKETRGQIIETSDMRVHRSVKTRLEAATEHGKHYKPKTSFDLERTTWVE